MKRQLTHKKIKKLYKEELIRRRVPKAIKRGMCEYCGKFELKKEDFIKVGKFYVCSDCKHKTQKEIAEEVQKAIQCEYNIMTMRKDYDPDSDSCYGWDGPAFGPYGNYGKNPKQNSFPFGMVPIDILLTQGY